MNRIKELRKTKGLSQEQLSYEIGIARSTLAMYESSKIEPPFSVLIGLSEFFNVSIDYILGHSNSVEVYDRIGLPLEPLTITFVDNKKQIHIFKVDNESFDNFISLTKRTALHETTYTTQEKDDI